MPLGDREARLRPALALPSHERELLGRVRELRIRGGREQIASKAQVGLEQIPLSLTHLIPLLSPSNPTGHERLQENIGPRFGWNDALEMGCGVRSVGTPRIERHGEAHRRIVQNASIDEGRQPLLPKHRAVGPGHVLGVCEGNRRECPGKRSRSTHAEHQRLQGNILRMTEARVVNAITLPILGWGDVRDRQRGVPRCRSGRGMVDEVQPYGELLLQFFCRENRIAVLTDVNGRLRRIKVCRDESVVDTAWCELSTFFDIARCHAEGRVERVIGEQADRRGATPLTRKEPGFPVPTEQTEVGPHAVVQAFAGQRIRRLAPLDGRREPVDGSSRCSGHCSKGGIRGRRSRAPTPPGFGPFGDPVEKSCLPIAEADPAA